VSVALFLLAITVLIFVHELGHFLAARSVGVRVLCFSIGFGPALARFQYGHTEFRLAMIPLGGYLKMLGDSPDGSTDAGSAVESFAAQTPLRRAWIAFAGPLANLLLAWVLFAALVWGVPEEPSTRLEQPAAGTLAATLGIERGDRVMAVDNASVDHWRALEGALREVEDDDFELILERAGPLRIDAQSLNAQRASTDSGGAPFVLTAAALGFRPMAKALQIGQVMPQSAAEEAGLQAGDRIVSVDGRAVSHSQALIALIQQSTNRDLLFRLEREGQDLELVVRPKVVQVEVGSGASTDGAGAMRPGASSGPRGRIGATLVPEYDMVAVERDLVSVVAAATAQTWHVTALTTSSLWKILWGEMSWRNLGGPLAIADQANQSAQRGGSAFLGFLAVLSIGLFVLNMLPLPILDGGHLLYCALEAVRGKALSESLRMRLQQFGLAAVLALTLVALFNDLSRYL
jgi:regulator of sigma E protease